jgi:hypothetical protein
MYTTYFAILSLIFFVLENPDSPTAKDGVLKDAMEGKNTLAGLAKKSMAADRCSQSLNVCTPSARRIYCTKLTMDLQCLFKTLPEMLKNRQSSKAPVNLKRSAPSSVAVEAEPAQTQAEQMTLPHRSSTFPAHMISNNPKLNPTSRRQKSMDTTTQFNNRSTESGTQSAWMAASPELLTEAMSTPEPVSATSLASSFSNQDQSSLAWAQQFSNPNNLPDLMPMMFPSDDPFAYPTQPMSTLEDDHFRHDRAGVPQSSFPFEQSAGRPPSTPSDPNMPSPSFDSFSNLPGFSVGTHGGIKSSVPSRLQASNTQSMNSSRLNSPISQAQSPIEALSSPDLVSIPNQNFVWQGYNFQPSNIAPQPTTSQAPENPAPNGNDNGNGNGILDFNMGLDENAMGLKMEGISFDDLFGNNAAYNPGNMASNDDWTQWMNAGT